MILNNVDLNKLKCFQAVAEKGGLQEGAKFLNLTTSAVYQSIKKLEDEMQKHLFFRSGKKYVLTDEGRTLQALFQKFLWDFSQFHDAGGSTAETVTEIRVGLPLNFSKSVFVPLIRKFCQDHPKVKFHLTIAETRRLLQQITAFELDFAVTDDAIPQEFLTKVSKKEMFKEELVMVCSKTFYKQNEKHMKSLKTMKELAHLDYSKALPLLQRWYKLHYKRQVKIADVHSIDNVETMLAALKEGMGLGIIPKDLASADLHFVPTSRTFYNQLYLVQEENYINSNVMKMFIQHLHASLS